MKNKAFSTLMASAVVFGSSMAGCTGTSAEHPKVAVDDSQSLAPRIERMLADKNAAPALTLAEQLVSLDPQNSNARAMLGRAYLANGRYVSAHTAFSDALTLGNRDPRTIVSLALSEAGMGNLDGARQLLADHIADLPAGDYGLAMAMAGDAREGVRALIEAARAPDATAKTRQNLAYALAMAGAWGQARLVAGQDLAARDAETRIGEWAQSFQQAMPAERVVAMIGVAPRADDAGLPAQLALNQTPKTNAPVLASAADLIEDARQPVAAPSAAAAPAGEDTPASANASNAGFAPGALAAALAKTPVPTEPAPSATSSMAANAAFAAPQPRDPVASPAALNALIAAQAPTAPMQPSYAAVPTKPAASASAPVAGRVALAAPAQSAKQPAAPFRKPVAANPRAFSASWTAGIGAPASDAKASDWVVQLGAFDSEAVAREKWQHISGGRQGLKSFSAVHSTFALNGRSFHRLAIRGFENHVRAAAACSALRSSGQACFVRLDDTQATRQARAETGKPGAAQASAQPSGRSGRAK